MPKGFPPGVFIIGSQKSGTTQLASLLDQHPDICVARSKEPDIYSRFWSKGLDAFKDEFSDTNAICLDASTSYTSACLPKYFPQDEGVESNFNGVVEHIYSVVPNARFIYIMRDPVNRTFSAYWHQVRAGSETRSFKEAIKEDTYYLRTSHYFGQIELYLERFSKSQFLFLTFEEFIKNPYETARACFTFLGLRDDIELVKDGGQNKSFVYGGLFGRLNTLLNRIGGINTLVKLIKPIVPRKFLEWGASRITQQVPKISGIEYEMMEGMFNNSISQLEELTGKEYLMWRSRPKNQSAEGKGIQDRELIR